MPSPRSALQPKICVVAALLVASLVVGGLAGSLPAAASDAGSDEHVAVEQDEFNTTRGTLVELPIQVPPGTEATLFLQRTTMAVTSRAVVRDGGDGEIRVVLNTYNGNWSVVNVTDTVVSQDRTPSRRVLPDAYQFTVSTEDRAAFARVNVGPRSLQRVTAWRTVTPPVDLTDASDIRAAITDGDLVRAESVRENDSLVLQLDAPGLDGALAAMPGANTTARFRHLFATHGTIGIKQTNPAPGRMRASIDVLNSSGVTIYPDFANGTYYLRLDLSEVRVDRGDDPDPDFDFSDAEFVTNVGLDANTNLSEDGDRLAAYVSPLRARVAHDPDEPLELSADSGQLVNGTTTVGTGSNVTVVLRGLDDDATPENESFIRRSTVTVVSPLDSAHSRFQAEFDLTDVDDTTRATIDVRFDGESILEDTVDVRVEPSTRESTTSTTSRDPTTTTSETSTTTTSTGESASTSMTPGGRTDGSVPGPGILGALLAVLSGLGLLAHHRD